MVIPVRDGERFIEACIGSVLAQTTPAAEILVVDDGSTDRTADVVEAFGGIVRRIGTAHHGVSAARNRGIAEACGDVVAFLDADDVWLPRKLEDQLAALAAAPGATGACSGYAITDASLRPRRIVRQARPEATTAVRRALLIEGPGVGFSFTGLVTREAADRVGGFDERLSTSADLDFAWRLTQDGPLVAVPGVLALHRHHAASQMHCDTACLARDMRSVIDAAEAAGLSAVAARRARANLARYLAVRAIRDQPSPGAFGRALATVPRVPSGTVRMAVEAAVRRPSRRVGALRTSATPSHLAVADAERASAPVG